jgi:copper chaperone
MNTLLQVEGMTCPSCVRHIDNALREIDGVSKVDVRLREGQVVVTHEGAATETLVEAVREAGYDAKAA